MDPSSLPSFGVQVRVQRAFSFEELQSGAYFASFDESDLQFYRVYGQPILIPPDDLDANFAVHTPDLHADCPPVVVSKSYTLQNPLGAPPTHTPDWRLVKQEPAEALFSSQLYTLPEHDDCDASMTYLPDQKPALSVYGEPPMDSLPFPPPVNSASPPYFSSPPQSQATPDSSSFHDTAFPTRDWEDRLSAPTQPYMLSELPSPHSQQYTPPSVTRSHRHHSRSPSPALSAAPHSKRNADKKPALACLFCRGRKIACGPPQPGSKDKTCNQCARRHLKCEYPLESRRGMRKRRSLIPRTSSPEINPDRPRVHIKATRKRSVDKS